MSLSANDENTQQTGGHITRRSALGFAIMAVAAPMSGYGAEFEKIKVRDLWAERGEFSDLAKRLEGKFVELRGYMAPPLKPEAGFFVLTRIPMAVCPFCDNGAAWPDDLLLVRMALAIQVVAFNDLIITRGRLEIGTKTDEATGFVSRVRLIDASYIMA